MMRQDEPADQSKLSTYCTGFSRAYQPWPVLPLDDESEMKWWREFAAGVAKNEYRGHRLLLELARFLPQLSLPQVEGISRSHLYKQLVLQGNDVSMLSPERVGVSPAWRSPEEVRFWIAPHPCGAVPVLATSDRQDFLQLVRALAYRAEPISLAEGLHAQAVSGLIHWGIISMFGMHNRTRLVLLHDSPYGSVSAHEVPGMLTPSDWLKASTTLRLEHELTHLAVKRLLGEMRLNLLDELIADCMGMLAALGFFDARLFHRCLGLDDESGRWSTYVNGLSAEQRRTVVSMVMIRADELQLVLGNHLWLCSPAQAMTRLHWLCQQRLDQPIGQPPKTLQGHICDA